MSLTHAEKFTFPQVIVVEGCNGSGKGTYVKAISDRLSEEGVEHVVLAMIPEGDFRDMVKKNSEISPEARMLLYRAASLEVDRQIRQALGESKWVILDRGWISFEVYQGIMENLSKAIAAMERGLQKPFSRPTFQVFLQLPLETILEQRAARCETQEEKDHYEEQGRAFDALTYEAYNVVFQEYMEKDNTGSSILQIFDPLPPVMVADEVFEMIASNIRESLYAVV